MKKPIGIAAIIALAISLTWAADQVANWLGFQPQPPAQDQSRPPGEQSPPGNEGVPPSPNATPGAQSDNQSDPSTAPDLSAEVASIEEDLARIEEALESDEVLDEFTPSEPLSADNPIPMPTDI